MAQTFNTSNKNYDADFYPVDAAGNRTGDKDWGAWNAAQPQAQPQAQPTAAAPPPPSGAQPTGGWQGLSDSVFGTLKKNIGDTGVVDQNDPAYRQAITSNEAQSARAMQQAREAAIQRRAATGTGTSGAVDTDVNKIEEQRALTNSQFEANLLGQFRQQGLDRAAQGLQLGAGMLTAQQERDLRAALTREGYGLQRDLASDDLNFRRDALGQQLGLSQAEMDQQAMLALLR